MCVLGVTEREAVKTCPADIMEQPEVEVVAAIIIYSHAHIYTESFVLPLCEEGGHSSVFVFYEVFRCSWSKYEA